MPPVDGSECCGVGISMQVGGPPAAFPEFLPAPAGAGFVAATLGCMALATARS